MPYFPRVNKFIVLFLKINFRPITSIWNTFSLTLRTGLFGHFFFFTPGRWFMLFYATRHNHVIHIHQVYLNTGVYWTIKSLISITRATLTATREVCYCYFNKFVFVHWKKTQMILIINFPGFFWGGGGGLGDSLYNMTYLCRSVTSNFYFFFFRIYNCLTQP